MESPIVSIDVSNGNSHYMCFIKNNKRFGKVKKIDHDIEGFKRLLEDIQKLEAETNEKVCAVFEATGVYTKPLERFLSKNSIKTYIINPLESARKRKEEIHNKKTDKLDPISISKVYYDKEEMMELTKKDETHNWLRKKNRLYEDQLNHLRKYKVTFQNQLSICFPGYLDLFKDGYSDIPMTILKKYPHPDLLKNKKAETVARYLEKNTCHTHKVSLEYALKIIEFAKKTYPGCEKDDVEVEIFKILLDKVIETPQKVAKEFPADKAGLNVLFVPSEAPYHERKVTLLNGPHTVLSPVAYLSGVNIVRDACQHEVIGKYIHKVMFDELMETLNLPKDELEKFATDVLERFNNPFVDHAVTSIMLNSFPKYETRDLPGMKTYLERKGKLPKGLVLGLAAIITYYKGGVRTDGAEIVPNDAPEIMNLLKELWTTGCTKKVTEGVLGSEFIWGEDLNKIPGLAEAVKANLDSILEKGMLETVKDILL